MTPEDIDRALEPLRQYAADRLAGKLPPPDLAEIERNTRGGWIGVDAEGQ